MEWWIEALNFLERDRKSRIKKREYLKREYFRKKGIEKVSNKKIYTFQVSSTRKSKRRILVTQEYIKSIWNNRRELRYRKSVELLLSNEFRMHWNILKKIFSQYGIDSKEELFSNEGGIFFEKFCKKYNIWGMRNEIPIISFSILSQKFHYMCRKCNFTTTRMLELSEKSNCPKCKNSEMRLVEIKLFLEITKETTREDILEDWNRIDDWKKRFFGKPPKRPSNWERDKEWIMLIQKDKTCEEIEKQWEDEHPYIYYCKSCKYKLNLVEEKLGLTICPNCNSKDSIEKKEVAIDYHRIYQAIKRFTKKYPFSRSNARRNSSV